MQQIKNIIGGIVFGVALFIAPAIIEPLTEWLVKIIF